MNVLFVLEYYYPHIGGVEVVFKTLAEGLASAGHTVTVVTQKLPSTLARETVNNVRIIRIKTLNRYLFSFLAIPTVVRLAGAADIVHTTTYNGALPARMGAWLRRKPCVITVHEVLRSHWKAFLGLNAFSAFFHRLLEKIIVHLGFHQYVCVSHATRKELLKEGIDTSKVSVVYNGVDYSFFNPARYSGKAVRKKLGTEKNFVVLFFGRPGGSKGLEYLIRSIPVIKHTIGSIKLVALVSKSAAYQKQYAHMLSLIDTLHLRNDIILLDAVKRTELPSYILSADCVCVPSLSEGFGFTAAETCAMGVPVVASNTASLPEVVSGKYVLVKPKDPEAIAQGVLLVHKKKYAASKLKKFLITDNIKGYEKVYTRLGQP